MHRALGFAACLSLLIAGSVGCDKNDGATANPGDASAPADTTDVADAAGDVEGDDSAGDAETDEGGEDEAVDEGAESEGGDTGEVAANDTPADAGTDAGTPAAAAASDGPPPLPKAKYTKVDNSCGKDPGVGQKLKSFKLKSVDGKTMSNRSWGSKVLLVNFWGTWCKPCLKELPEFARLYRRYRKHGMVLVAIATDDDAEAVKAILRKSKISAKVAIGGEDYAGKYNSPKFPFTFVVDPKGNIKSSFRGYEPKCMGKLEADIRTELEARNAKK